MVAHGTFCGHGDFADLGFRLRFHRGNNDRILGEFRFLDHREIETDPESTDRSHRSHLDLRRLQKKWIARYLHA